MSAAGPDRLAQLELRVAALEQRLAGVAPGAAAGAPSVPPLVQSTDRLVPSQPSLAGATAAPPVSPAVPRPPRPPVRTRSLADLEEQLSSRLLAWVGGIALIIGAMFFLSLAFSRGWIGPEARVLIGLIGGASALAAGAWLFDRGDRTPATVLTGVGVGTGALALFAAGRLFELVPVEMTLVGFLVIAVATAVIALRAGSQAVAAFGIVATTLAPPVLGAAPTLATVAFLAIAIAGVALISLGRSWPWLALLAFLATAPQAASWFFGERSISLAVAGVVAFWAVNAAAASGSALRGVAWKVHRASAALLVLNALFAIGAITRVLPDDPVGSSILLSCLAGAHGGLAIELLLRRPRRHPFGVLVAGLAIGTLAIGMAIELGGVARPIGHAALAVAVAWVAIRFRERVAAAWAGATFSLAIADFVLVQYPIGAFGSTEPEGWPFGSPAGIVALVMAAALIVTAIVARQSFAASPPKDRRLTSDRALAVGGVGAVWIVGYASAFEFPMDNLIVAWAGLAACAFGLAAFVRRDVMSWSAGLAGGVSLLVAAVWGALPSVAPVRRLAVDPDRVGPVVPLLNGESLALLALVVSLGIAGWVVARLAPQPPAVAPSARARLVAVAVVSAGVLAIHLLSIAIADAFQARLGSGTATEEIATQAQVALSIAWVVIGAGAFATGVVRRLSLARLFGLGLLSVATAKVFLFDLASLDVAYRVLSFIGLGGVLLASSFVAARFRSPGGGSSARPEPIGDPLAAAEPDRA